MKPPPPIRGLNRNPLSAVPSRHASPAQKKEPALAKATVWVTAPSQAAPAKTASSRAFEELKALIGRRSAGLVGDKSLTPAIATVTANSANAFKSLDTALTAKKTRAKRPPPETVSKELVAKLADKGLPPRKERELHKVALTEVYRLFNRPGVDDAFHAQVGEALGRVHSVSAKELSAAEAREVLSPFDEDQRRANALLALIHSSRGKLKELKLPEGLKANMVSRLGESADASSLRLLKKLAASKSAPVSAAAKQAMAEVKRASKMTIVSVAMETPFSAVGGLSNVMGAEPQALLAKGHDTYVITPRHGHIDPKTHGLVDSGLGDFTLDTPDGPRSFRLLKTYRGGVPYYFVDDFVAGPRQPLFSNRQGVYSDAHGEFGDNPARFDFFARAAVVAQKAILKGKEPDIIQANDSHTGLVPFYVKEAGLKKTATTMVIHNLAFQGTFDMPKRTELMVGRDSKNDALFGPMGGLEFYGQLNLMKAGLTQADGVMTVSEKYRDETLTLKDKGAGLGGVLAVKAAGERYFGRMNGVDLTKWNPKTDPALPYKFDVSNLAGKAANKAALLKKYGLTDEPGVALHVSVGRIDGPQKGYDDLFKVIAHSMTKGPKAKFILMGTGDRALMAQAAALAKQYPQHVAFDPKFTPEGEHQLIAGGDFLQMLSRFEPGGQPNIYALATGTIPLVRATGGLDQAITAYSPSTGSGNGFKFTGDDPLPMFLEASALYAKGPAAMKPLIENAFSSAKQFTWEKSADQTAAIFRRLL
ncbi:MAG: glycogen synthase [Myxococcaceae bacterium]|nr:glycogen synthase [Myxococcaceae bacterium]